MTTEVWPIVRHCGNCRESFEDYVLDNIPVTACKLFHEIWTGYADQRDGEKIEKCWAWAGCEKEECGHE